MATLYSYKIWSHACKIDIYTTIEIVNLYMYVSICTPQNMIQVKYTWDLHILTNGGQGHL